MSILNDTGTDNRDLTVTNFPAFQQTGFVGEAKATRFYNPGAGSDIDRAGGSFFVPMTELYIPDGGMAIEVIFKDAPLLNAPPYNSSPADGKLLFSLNGSNKKPNILCGGISLIVPTGVGAGMSANRLALTSNNIAASARTPGWTPAVGSFAFPLTDEGVVADANSLELGTTLFHHAVLNITYSRLVDSTTAHVDLYVGGRSFALDVPVLVPFVQVSPTDRRLPLLSYNIGGFEYDGASVSVIKETRSFDGLIDQVRIFDHPLSSTEILAIATGYGLNE